MKHIKVLTVSTLCLPVAWSERVGMYVCVSVNQRRETCPI